MSITNEQWDSIKIELLSMHCNVSFMYMGYKISVQRVFKSVEETFLLVFINEKIEGKWMINNNSNIDIDPKLKSVIKAVWRKRTKGCFPTKEVNRLKKQLGAKQAKELFPNLEKKHIWWVPDFLKASTLCHQFKKLKGISVNY